MPQPCSPFRLNQERENHCVDAQKPLWCTTKFERSSLQVILVAGIEKLRSCATDTECLHWTSLRRRLKGPTNTNKGVPVKR